MTTDAGRLLQAFAERLASGRLTWRRLPDGTGVVVDTERLTTSSLTGPGVRILELIAEGVNDLDTVTDHLAEELSIERAVIRSDLESFTSDLAGQLKMTQSD